VLDRDGLKDIGLQRVGTVCLLLDAIGKLKKEARTWSLSSSTVHIASGRY
jgi:hypothetical protein